LEWGIGGNTTAHIIIARGNATVNSISYVLTNSGQMVKDSANPVYRANNETGDLNITFVGSANGFVALTLAKY
jgi:hypothetical protein